ARTLSTALQTGPRGANRRTPPEANQTATWLAETASRSAWAPPRYKSSRCRATLQERSRSFLKSEITANLCVLHTSAVQRFRLTPMPYTTTATSHLRRRWRKRPPTSVQQHSCRTIPSSIMVFSRPTQRQTVSPAKQIRLMLVRRRSPATSLSSRIAPPQRGSGQRVSEDLKLDEAKSQTRNFEISDWTGPICNFGFRISDLRFPFVRFQNVPSRHRVYTPFRGQL